MKHWAGKIKFYILRLAKTIIQKNCRRDILSDDDTYVFVRKENEQYGTYKKKSEVINDDRYQRRNKRDWVLGDDGKAHDTIVGEEYVEEDR